MKLICSVCCMPRAGQAALNASVLGLSQVTNWTLPPRGTKPLTLLHRADGESGLRLLRTPVTILGHPKASPSPLCRLAPCCPSQAAASALNLCLLWKNTLHRSGCQSDSSGSTFKVTVIPGLVQRATETGTQHTPTPLPSSSYQFSASLGSISTNEGWATSKNWIKQRSFLPYLLQKSNTFSWISQNH